MKLVMIVKKQIHQLCQFEKKLIEQLKQTTGKEYRSTSECSWKMCIICWNSMHKLRMQTEIKNSVEAGAKVQLEIKEQKSNYSKKITGISNSFTGDLTKTAMQQPWVVN